MRDEVAKIVVRLEDLQKELFQVIRHVKREKNRGLVETSAIQLLVPIGTLKKALGGENK